MSGALRDSSLAEIQLARNDMCGCFGLLKRLKFWVFLRRSGNSREAQDEDGKDEIDLVQGFLTFQ